MYGNVLECAEVADRGSVPVDEEDPLTATHDDLLGETAYASLRASRRATIRAQRHF